MAVTTVVKEGLVEGCTVLTWEQRRWLNDLRRSGAVNMFGAYPLLAEAFDLPRDQARTAWKEWTKVYSEEVDG